MDYKQVAKDTAKVLQSYLTYQAVRIIIEQLKQTNPQQAIWLSHYSDRKKVQDSENYINSLVGEDKELVLRILTVRANLAENVLEFLPEMTMTGINQANIEHRRYLLERLTQTTALTSSTMDGNNTQTESNKPENKEE